ncbi:MAG: helix-turn-helix transcriptional regulator [Clostridiales bacterium]|nr:helix-turn-helix transcriptional regulator [Clostridiales bacterium]
MVDLALRSLVNQREYLGEINTRQTPLAQRYMLLQALHSSGENYQDQEENALESLLSGSHFTCLLIKASSLLTRQLLEHFFIDQNDLHCIDVKMAAHRLIVIGYSQRERARGFLEELDLWAKDQEVKIGTSEEYTQFSHLSTAYQQGVDALSYHYLFQDRGIIRYQEIRNREKSRISLRAMDTAALKYEIQLGNQEGGAKELSTLSKRWIEEKRIGVKNYQSLMKQLGDQLAEEFQRQEHPIVPMPSPQEFENCQLFLQQASQWLLEQMERGRGKGISSTEELISEYIKKHLSDPALSQAQVAQALGYTPSYFSRYFKEKFHRSYNDYVAEKRIQMAKELMDEKEYLVTELAEKTGFTNDASFRRVFKALEGMTPSQYQRKINRESPKGKEASKF